VRRFLASWALLSPVCLVAAALSSWLVLRAVDLTYEAFAAWLLVPLAQAAALSAGTARRPLLPPGRPPLAATLPVGLAAVGLVGPASGSHALPRLLALVAGVSFLAAAGRLRDRRLPLAAAGALLVVLGLDAVRPYLASLPSTLLPRLRPFLSGLVVHGAVVVLLFAAGLAAQRRLEDAGGWPARLLGLSLALLFAALHAALLQLFLHPWLERPWNVLVSGGVSLSAALAASSALAALAAPRGEA
jgi:hypothetical protein